MNIANMMGDPEVTPFFDGVSASSESERTVDVVNPSNASLLLKIPEGCAADADRCVESARRAFDDGRWSDVPPSIRKKVLHRFADLIASESARLDELDAGEMGKPRRTAAFNAESAASFMRFNAEAVDKVMGDVFGSDCKSLAVQRRVPRGVVAAIVPWNFPTFNATLKIAPALAAGNCVVLKPSEMSSRSAMRLAQLAVDAGLPAGVLNVAPGLGETVGKALSRSMDVNMVAFTGSTEVGKLMMQHAGMSNMKVVMAECGGKSPQIVFDDGVDLDAASDSIAGFLLTNQGQICSVGSRVLVQRRIEEIMLERIADRMKHVVIGDALDPKTTFGPLVSARQCERVMSYIGSAESEGAQLVCGGHRTRIEAGGFFVEPTLFRGVSPSSRIAREEIFGPVLSVIPFDTDDDAIRIANGTEYGLAAYVWTANLSTGMRMAKSIRSLVVINSVGPGGEGPGHAGSWEPTGLSGLGTEGGLAGIESYLRRQFVWFNHA